MRKAITESNNSIAGITGAAMRVLESYTWPGNIRQLRNVICRACILAEGNPILPKHLKLASPKSQNIPEWLMELPMQEIEKTLILANLDRFAGNKTKTAEHLGITSRTLHNKIKLYDESRKAA